MHSVYVHEAIQFHIRILSDVNCQVRCHLLAAFLKIKWWNMHKHHLCCLSRKQKNTLFTLICISILILFQPHSLRCSTYRYQNQTLIVYSYGFIMTIWIICGITKFEKHLPIGSKFPNGFWASSSIACIACAHIHQRFQDTPHRTSIVSDLKVDDMLTEYINLKQCSHWIYAGTANELETLSLV